jgi:pyruvate,water dikinase
MAATSQLEAPAEREALVGLGIGTEVYVGTARVGVDAEDVLARMEPGDVLIAPFTNPAYNVVLSMAGAVVCQQGGPLSHAAVMAREFGFPAVVGALDAMTAIKDGDTVEVDPTTGRVRVL